MHGVNNSLLFHCSPDVSTYWGICRRHDICLHRICSFRECGLANIGLRMLGGKMCECRDEGRAEVERWDERIWEGGNGNMSGGVRMRGGKQTVLSGGCEHVGMKE